MACIALDRRRWKPRVKVGVMRVVRGDNEKTAGGSRGGGHHRSAKLVTTPLFRTDDGRTKSLRGAAGVKLAKLVTTPFLTDD